MKGRLPTRRNLIRFVALSFVVLCLFVFFRDTTPATATGPSVKKQSISSSSYQVHLPPACWAPNCHGVNNAEARNPCKDAEASRLNNHGVDAMERLVSGVTSPSSYSARYFSTGTKYFEQALQHDPTCESALVNLALLDMFISDLSSSQNRFGNAVENINKAMSAVPNVARHFVIRGFLQELTGNDNQARADWDYAIQLSPAIAERRYFGIMIANDTRMEKHTSVNLVHKIGTLGEKRALRAALFWTEFSPIKFSKYSQHSSLEHEAFVKNRYTVLRSIIPPFVFGPIQSFYREAIQDKILNLNDGQSKRYFLSNDRIARFIQYSLTDLLRVVIAHDGQPSYTYFGGYVAGAVLAPHADRRQCEFTFSITLYQNPPDDPWPLALGSVTRFEKDSLREGGYLDFPPEDEHVIAPLYEGDALLFMGRHMIHWRVGPQPEGHETYNVFLHYVQDNFEFTLE